MTLAVDPYARPWRIPDEWTPAQREAFLNARAGAEAAQRPRELVQLAALVVRLANALPAKGPRWRRLAQAALYAVQRVPYRDDPAGQEWYQGAVYTLAFGGDCEDKAELLVELCMLLEVPARVVWVALPDQAYNHVSARVGPSDEWAETIIPGAELGEHPVAASQRLGHQGRLQSIRATPRGAPVRPSGALPSGAACPPEAAGWCLVPYRWNTTASGDARGWLQWMQPDKAAAWIARAVALTTEAEEARINALPLPAQRDATLAAWQALAYAYQACDLPPTSDPGYIEEVAAAYGARGGANYLGKPAAQIFTAHPATAGQAREQTVNWGDWLGAPEGWITAPTVARMQAVQPDRYRMRIIERILLDANGAPSLACLDLDTTQGAACWFSNFDPLALPTWNTLFWKADVSVPSMPQHWVLPPLRYTFQLARTIALRLAQLSPVDLVNRARKYVLLNNALTLSQFQEQHPDKLITSAEDALKLKQAAIDANQHNRGAAADTTISSLYGVAAALPFPANLAAGAALLATDFLTRAIALPQLTVVQYDPFGQSFPSFLAASISGSPDPNKPPRQVVPAPTGGATPSLNLAGLFSTQNLLGAVQHAGGTTKGGVVQTAAGGGSSSAPAAGWTDGEKAAAALGVVGTLGLLGWAVSRSRR